MLRYSTIALALLVAVTQGSELQATAEAKSRAEAKSMAGFLLRAHQKLPWANMDADGSDEMEYGNEDTGETDPKTFSLAAYDHPDARDDADQEENSKFEDDFLNHGDDSGLDPADLQDENDEDDDD